jgi:hypothetical protein
LTARAEAHKVGVFRVGDDPFDPFREMFGGRTVAFDRDRSISTLLSALQSCRDAEQFADGSGCGEGAMKGSGNAGN